MLVSHWKKRISLNKIFQNIPNREDVAHGATQNEEVEDGMHIGAFVQRVEQRSGNVTGPFTDNPTHGMRTHGIHQWLEGDQYDKSHQDIANRFQITVFL